MFVGSHQIIIGMEKHFLTKEKYEDLKAELERMKKEGRMEIAERLKKAKEYGDLSENAEYSEAKEAQAKIEFRIVELENILRNSALIKKATGKTTIDIGSVIEVEKSSKNFKYTIVGSKEVDPEKNFISNVSPLGKAFIGKKAGDTVEVHIPKGKTKYKIISIE